MLANDQPIVIDTSKTIKRIQSQEWGKRNRKIKNQDNKLFISAIINREAIINKPNY